MSKDWMILFLVAALLAIGFTAGWFWARSWYAYDEPEPLEGVVLPLEPRPVQMEDFWDDHVSNLELLTVVPENVSRPDAPHDPGPGHTTSTWLMERRLWMDAHYPLPAGA